MPSGGEGAAAGLQEIAQPAQEAAPKKQRRFQWCARSHKAMCDAIRASLNDNPGYVKGLNDKVFRDTVARLQQLNVGLHVTAVQQHYRSYVSKVNDGVQDPWGVPFTQLLPSAQWKLKEHEMFLSKLAEHKLDFAAIANALPNRTQESVKQHYKRFKCAIENGSAVYCGLPCDRSMIADATDMKCGYCRKFDKPCELHHKQRAYCSLTPLCPQCKLAGQCVDETGALSACQTVCDICYESGHSKKNCPNNPNLVRKEQQCTVCKLTGHRFETCEQFRREWEADHRDIEWDDKRAAAEFAKFKQHVCEACGQCGHHSNSCYEPLQAEKIDPKRARELLDRHKRTAVDSMSDTEVQEAAYALIKKLEFQDGETLKQQQAKALQQLEREKRTETQMAWQAFRQTHGDNLDLSCQEATNRNVAKLMRLNVIAKDYDCHKRANSELFQQFITAASTSARADEDEAVDVTKTAEKVKKAKLTLDKLQALNEKLQPFRDRIRNGSNAQSDAMIFDFLDKFKGDENEREQQLKRVDLSANGCLSDRDARSVIALCGKSVSKYSQPEKKAMELLDQVQKESNNKQQQYDAAAAELSEAMKKKWTQTLSVYVQDCGEQDLSIRQQERRQRLRQQHPCLKPRSDSVPQTYMSRERKDAVALINKHDCRGKKQDWVSGRNGVLKAEIQRANNALSERRGTFSSMFAGGDRVDVFKPYSYVGYANAPPQQHSRNDEPVLKLSLPQVAQRLPTDTEAERKRKERSEAFAAGMKRCKPSVRMMKPRGVLPFKTSLRTHKPSQGSIDIGFVDATPPNFQQTLAKKREREEQGRVLREQRRRVEQQDSASAAFVDNTQVDHSSVRRIVM